MRQAKQKKMVRKNKDRFNELRAKIEKEKKLLQLKEKIETLPLKHIRFLSFEESINFLQQADKFPQNKWQDGLYIQAAMSFANPIEDALKSFLDFIEKDKLYLFFLNYNFGLVEFSKIDCLHYWAQLIELDQDEIWCYDPHALHFICIEKTKDFIIGKEQEGRQWFYELTFSNKSLQERIIL